MKNNKGFTLVELLGIIIVLVLVGMISFRGMSNMLDKTRINEYNRYVEDMYTAAQNYIYANGHVTGLKEVGSKIFVRVDTLYANNIIKKIPKNPKTEKEATFETIVATKQNDGTLSYEYIDHDITISAYNASGLIVHYDAINNTKGGKDNNAILWENLIGNDYYGVINGANWENGGLYFDNNDYVTMGEHNYDNVTIEIIASTKPLNNDETRFIISNNENGGYGINLTKTIKSPSTIVSTVVFKGDYIGNSYGLNNDQRYYLGLRVNSSQLVLNVNNQKNIVNNNNPIKMTTNGTSLVLGGNPAGQTVNHEFFKGTIYAVRVYNRVLTDEEIIQNYEIDKARFNLD